ncbi:MAG: hypothetical protein ACI9EW_001597 [Cellvibrionaceae bacterium]
MHDISDLEQRGVVGMFVASSEFVTATKAQAEALGYDPAVVFVQHPIQDRSDDEMKEIADNAFEDVLNAILASS